MEERSCLLAPCWKKEKKKTAIALLHDWAFVTAIVLPATSARDSVAPSQAACNQSLMTHN